MKNLFALLLSLCTAVWAVANDGSFTMSGNQLIPIVESDIGVQKEILSLNRVGNQIQVSVYYEFFNPAEPKDLLVGFEAAGPYMFNLDDAMRAFPEHPNMRGFKVFVNGAPLSWQVAHIGFSGHFDENNEWVEEPYYKNGNFRKMTDRQCKDALRESEDFDYPFYFVYYFTAHFNKGLNIIMHTYNYDLSSSSGAFWKFSYILTAACRWANRRIDDFTLHVNMGDRCSFCVDPSFYGSCREWSFDVAGRAEPNYSEEAFFMGSYDLFHVRDGGMTFHKTKFRPEGELYVFQPMPLAYEIIERFISDESIKDFISGCYYDLQKPTDIQEAICPENRQILRNLPFAYHGYVFKNASLQRFFEDTSWYVPNPKYKVDMNSLTKGEKEWVQFWAQDN